MEWLSHANPMEILLALLGVVAVSWGLFLAIDSWHMPLRRRIARVTGMAINPSYEYVIFVDDFPYPMTNPESYLVTIQFEGTSRTVSMSVEEDFFRVLAKGDKVEATYSQGRFTGHIYLERLKAV